MSPDCTETLAQRPMRRTRCKRDQASSCPARTLHPHSWPQALSDGGPATALTAAADQAASPSYRRLADLGCRGSAPLQLPSTSRRARFRSARNSSSASCRGSHDRHRPSAESVRRNRAAELCGYARRGAATTAWPASRRRTDLAAPIASRCSASFRRVSELQRVAQP